MTHKILDRDPKDEILKAFQVHWDKFMDFSWCRHWDEKIYYSVFYGMSGYSGYIVMQSLTKSSPTTKTDAVTYACAGRSVAKVQMLRDREFAVTQWEDMAIMTASLGGDVPIIDLVKSASVKMTPMDVAAADTIDDVKAAIRDEGVPPD